MPATSCPARLYLAGLHPSGRRAMTAKLRSVARIVGLPPREIRWSGRFVPHVEIHPAELLPLHDSHEEPVTGYEIDLRRAVIKGRGAVARARPLIRDWRVTFTFVADTTMLPHDKPRELRAGFLADAGARIGIGDYRPEKTGWFGRFTVLE